MALEISRQILENTKFHENPSCGIRVLPYRGTDVTKLIVAFRNFVKAPLTLILRRSRTETVWFYTSTSNKRAVRPTLYTKSLTRDLKRMYSRFTLVRISINL